MAGQDIGTVYVQVVPSGIQSVKVIIVLSKSHEYAGSRNCQRMVSDFHRLRYGTFASRCLT